MLKPRNKVQAQAKFRKAGPHDKPYKSIRKKQKDSFRKLLTLE